MCVDIDFSWINCWRRRLISWRRPVLCSFRFWFSSSILAIRARRLSDDWSWSRLLPPPDWSQPLPSPPPPLLAEAWPLPPLTPIPCPPQPPSQPIMVTLCLLFIVLFRGCVTRRAVVSCHTIFNAFQITCFLNRISFRTFEKRRKTSKN